ncbi:MAG TPA: metal-dependent hydrolase [Thermoanaerobaculia bacterium]|nr:metal-dependent hydrolase [Thermoanaerobaculia bacterium]
MDNLCHSLVGAALSRAGLGKRTALATATLVIGANLPDVDVFAYAWGADTALGFRRGWTHGVLALALWPFVLTGIMMAWDRLVRRRRHPGAEPARPRELLLLSTISILTHPFLDWLNNYGMRWLMPFRDVWYYGDTLFIMDVWIWLALGAGFWLSRRRSKRGAAHAERPARVALAAVSIYILVLAGSQLAARRAARESLADAGETPDRLMAGPLPLNPLRRQIVADVGEGYALGTVDWLERPAYAPGDPAAVAKNASHPAIARAAATREGAIFLHWARFPFFLVEETPESWIVRMTDARYTLNPGTGFGALTVEVRKREGEGAPPIPAP